MCTTKFVINLIVHEAGAMKGSVRVNRQDKLHSNWKAEENKFLFDLAVQKAQLRIQERRATAIDMLVACVSTGKDYLIPNLNDLFKLISVKSFIIC